MPKKGKKFARSVPKGRVYGSCEACGGKAVYFDRKDAKIAARRAGFTGTQAFHCPTNPQFWHLGRIADEVRAGLKTREEVYGPHDELD